MHSITVENKFTASHRIMLPDGGMEAEHEHQWVVQTTVRREKLNRTGLVMDFHVLRQLVDNITVRLCGNELVGDDYFKVHNPTAENLARYIFGELKPKLGGGAVLESVRVMEEPGCWAGYCE